MRRESEVEGFSQVSNKMSGNSEPITLWRSGTQRVGTNTPRVASTTQLLNPSLQLSPYLIEKREHFIESLDLKTAEVFYPFTPLRKSLMGNH